MKDPTYVRAISVRDIRFPTSLNKAGSDAMHKDPDYSCAYVMVFTDSEFKGRASCFTIGRGTELVCAAVKSVAPMVVGKKLSDIYGNFGGFWRELTSESQLRWVGPEKGVIHMAVGAVVNALWDLWARLKCKPLWKMLSDMSPNELVSCIDFRYISDVLTPEEAVTMLTEMQEGKRKREEHVRNVGYPAYSTHAGWHGYSDTLVEQMIKQLMSEGWNNFKMKVGLDLEEDKRRLSMVRKIIGPERKLMVDANQKWDVQEAIDWMTQLKDFNIHWIEEPTSPDDVLGHKAIAEALNPLGIGVATGEQCQNRVIFKQLMQAKAIQFCQIDFCRVGGINENLAIILMAKKMGVPVCPHTGGVGLCELMQHLSIWDYVSVSGTTKGRLLEFVDHLHEHYVNPVQIRRGHYMVPSVPGMNSEIKKDSLLAHEYPLGSAWQELFKEGVFPNPSEGHSPLST